MTHLEEIEKGLAALAQTIVGLTLFALGVLALAWEKTHAPTHETHLLVALVVAFLGLAIVPSIGPVLVKYLGAIVGIFVAALSATRGGTPPAPPAPPTGGL